MQSIISLLCGVLFGVGLAISGMTNPAKVTGFLDLFGDWDPTLAVVMGSAVGASALGFGLARRMEHPWVGSRFHFPTRNDIDANLIVGATLFGVGWGIVGLCPGPAIANLSRGSSEAYMFFAAMTVGAILHHFDAKRRRRSLPVA